MIIRFIEKNKYGGYTWQIKINPEFHIDINSSDRKNFVVDFKEAKWIRYKTIFSMVSNDNLKETIRKSCYRMFQHMQTLSRYEIPDEYIVKFIDEIFEILNNSNSLIDKLYFNMVGCNQNKLKSDRNDLKLSNKVNTLREFYSVSIEKFENAYKGDKKNISSLNIFNYYIFNISGNKIEEIKYNPNGSLVEKRTYKYDEKGNKIEENLYNTVGRLFCKEIYKYDEKENKIERNYFNKEGNFILKMIYKYDNRGNEIEEERIDFQGFSRGKWTYKYDEYGNIIERNKYEAYGDFLGGTTFKYDEKGNNIEVKHFKFDGSSGSKWTYNYDENRNVIEENKYESDGNLFRKRTYKYDKKGNEIEENTFKSDGSLYEKLTYKYDYNFYGDWVNKIYFVNGIAKNITKREIEYFD